MTNINLSPLLTIYRIFLRVQTTRIWFLDRFDSFKFFFFYNAYILLGEKIELLFLLKFSFVKTLVQF